MQHAVAVMVAIALALTINSTLPRQDKPEPVEAKAPIPVEIEEESVEPPSPPKPAPKPAPEPQVVILSESCNDLRPLLIEHGITGSELTAALNLAQKESGCRQLAVNPSSGACNVFQELPCGKWGDTTDIHDHIEGAIGRVNGTYGGKWANAWNHFLKYSWW